jgi:adenine/guanine/hypoxanthine permease
MLEKIFHLKDKKTTVLTEIIAGLTTFAAMAYIIVVNPSTLSGFGEPGAMFVATILASSITTILMGLIANIPYACAPGLGLNNIAANILAGYTGYLVGLSAEGIIAVVLLSGIFNVLITITNVRKYIIKAIPESLQNAIGGGIGIFIIYIALCNVGLVNFTYGIPSINTGIDGATLAVFAIGLLLTILLLIKNVKGAILIGIIAATIVGIPLGVTNFSTGYNLAEAWTAYIHWFGRPITIGIPELFSNINNLIPTLIGILSFSLSDVYDSIGTFIGTGKTTGIFTTSDIDNMSIGGGLNSQMDKALFADSIATPIGALIGTSSTTTYVESAAGIGAGGKTGLTSIIIGVCFLLSLPFAGIISGIPYAATAPALICVGFMMMAPFTEIKWNDLSEAIPAVGASVIMGLTYGITNGIMVGFWLYTFVKICQGKAKDVSPIIWISDLLFILNYIL